MIQPKELNKTIEVKTFVATKDEQEILQYVKSRHESMKNYREQLKVEKEWKNADNEYIPHELDLGETRKRFEQDQDSGLRSRMVKIGGDDNAWRSNSANPTLLVKIQTALAQIIDNDPEGDFVPLNKLFESRTAIAKSIWKRNWHIASGREVLKQFTFNLFKYGWAVGRSAPKIIKYNKSILTSLDVTNPENNKYENKELIWFNDIYKQNLDPYRTWIDENTKVYDTYSMNDCYYEMDYSYDEAEVEFGNYKNWKFVPRNAINLSVEENKEKANKDRQDIVTIGFYQNRVKDLYIILVPKAGVVLHTCPLPNDDGMLDIWHAPLMLRSATCPYGVSIWEIIKQDKSMFDKWDNMTSDQLTLSIMKFGMYTGTSSVLGDGVMKIVPGQAKQMINGKIDWLEIPGPGQDAFNGLKMREAKMDSNTGISPTLEGDITGKTLGEIQLARESSLKRLKTPLENISWAVEQDAYLTLSWAKQIYSTPEIKEFNTEDEMALFEQENGIENGGVKIDEVTGEVIAQYYPELALHLEDRDGQLYESENSKFFTVGKDLKGKDLHWRGIFKVIPKSLIGNSQVILQQTKQEMFNYITPLLQMDPKLYKKAVVQLLKINDEKETDWLPDAWLVEDKEQSESSALPETSADQDLLIPQQEGSFQSQTNTGIQQPQTVVPPSQTGGIISQMFKQ